jgi:hypothetical protein
MQIDGAHLDGTAKGAVPFSQVRREATANVQSVFSELLMAAGCDGYASADPMPPADIAGDAAETQIQESWGDWYAVALRDRYRQAENKQEMGDQFAQVLLKAHREDAYVDPQAFLAGLSEQELETVQHVHWLADPIDVGSLTEEGALNLLIPPPAQVDDNHDGLTQTGEAWGIRFPDSNTPPEVAAAWEQVTADMPLRERIMYEFRMTAPVLLANIVLHADGSFAYQREPGDPDWVNPLAAADYSYTQAADEQIEYLEYFKAQIDPLRFEKDVAFWTGFRQSLEEHGAA